MSDDINSDQKQNGTQIFEERRKFLRLNVNVNIIYSVLTDTDQQTVTSKNISAGGICMITNEELKTGTKLKLEIYLPENLPVIHATGEVVWMKPFSIAGEEKIRYYIGVEFIQISDEERENIKKYVFSLS